MIELTVGYVAGIIALGVVAAQIWCPTALTFVLAGQLRSTESATTWTTAGRYLQSSFWPLLLRSDSTKNKSMPKLVVLTTFCLPVVTILIALAGVITPLGLYEEFGLAGQSDEVEFVYVQDSSHFFAGTSARQEQPFTRKCTYTVDRLIYSAPAPCPYIGDDLEWETDGLTFNFTSPQGVNVTVPNIVKEIYTSGTKSRPTTISNFFDVEWRQLTTQFDKDVDNGTRIAMGQFSLMESFVLDDAYRIVEGLVVNARTGGIGFRNHTLPVGLPRGATWFEDLLFIEPEVECANLNLTIDFGVSSSVGQTVSTRAVNLTLTDRGGFANFNKTQPANDTLNESNVPDLKGRAHLAAWMHTAYAMFLTNTSNPRNGSVKPYQYINSEVGKKFKLPPLGTDNGQGLRGMEFFGDLGKIFGVTLSADEDDIVYDNPHNITYDDFDWVHDYCQDTWPYDHVRPNTTYVACNIIRGTPRRVDEPGVIFLDNSQWSAPLYSCASAVKATIKTVRFFHNGTSDDLGNLVVESVNDKEYASEADMPLWGFEDWMYRLHEFEPVWGLVNAAYQGFRNITTLRAPSFYMLGSANSIDRGMGLTETSPEMNLPAALGPIKALDTIVGTSAGLGTDYDFSGKNRLSVWLKWQNLTSSADTMSRVIQLMWTDIAASAMVGTKGILGPGNAAGAGSASAYNSDEPVRMRVIPTVRKIRYHFLFGIPAFLVALCFLICGALAFGSLLLGRSSLSVVSQRLKQTSVGRALTTAFYPEASSFGMTPSEWVAVHGGKKLDLAGYAAPASEAPPLPARPGTGPAMVGSNKGMQYVAVPMTPSSPSRSPSPYR